MFFSIRRQGKAVFLAALIAAYFFTPCVFAQVAAAPVSSETQKPAKPKRKLPTGLLDLSGFKVKVFAYVPEGLDMEKKYPLIVMAPGDGDTPETQLEYILPVAKSLDCFVLTVGAWPKEGEPFVFDRWLLGVKNDVQTRFPIDSSKVYVVGRNLGGHYAAYLATNYPNDFSGAVVFGNAWVGEYTQLLAPKNSVSEQMPVVAAFAANQTDQQTQNEKWFLEYQKRGYPVSKMIAKEGQDLNSPEFVSDAIKALDEKCLAWKLIREAAGKTFKQRLKRGIKEFFEV